MNRGAISVIYLALSAVCLIGLYGVYKPQINTAADTTFRHVRIFTENGLKTPSKPIYVNFKDTTDNNGFSQSHVEETGDTVKPPAGYTFSTGNPNSAKPVNGKTYDVTKIKSIDPSDPSDTDWNKPDKYGITPAQWKQGLPVAFTNYEDQSIYYTDGETDACIKVHGMDSNDINNLINTFNHSDTARENGVTATTDVGYVTIVDKSTVYDDSDEIADDTPYTANAVLINTKMQM